MGQYDSYDIEFSDLDPIPFHCIYCENFIKHFLYPMNKVTPNNIDIHFISMEELHLGLLI